MKIRFIFAFLALLGLYLIVSFSRDLWHLWQKEGEIRKSQLKLEELRVKNEELKKQLEYVKSETFLEKEAREKLGLAKPGETVLILPENLEEALGINPPSISENQRLSNWERWWRLFF